MGDRTPPPHGTRARYQAGCKCPRCQGENTRYQRVYRAARTPRTVAVVTPGGYPYRQGVLPLDQR